MRVQRGAQLSDHLKLKGNVWYFRLAVPTALRDAAGRSEVVRSTGTSDRKHARRVAAREYLKATSWFDDLRQQRAPSDPQMVAVAQRVYAQQVAQWAAVAPQEIDEAHLASDVIDTWRGYLDGEGASHDTKIAVRDLVRANQFVLQEGTTPYRVFARKIARAHIAAAQEADRRARGDYSVQPVDDFTDASVSGPAAAPRGHSTSAPAANTVFNSWISANAHRWAAGTVREYRTGQAVFLDVLGDLPVALVTREDVRRLRDTAMKLPARWRQDPQWRGMSATEVVATDPVGPYVKPGTVQKYLQGAKGMFEYALEEGHVTANVAAGLTNVHDPEPVKAKRHEWTMDLLTEWFGQELYMVPRGSWTHYQWLPLLGLYTGARLEELARLKVAEVTEVDGILVLDIKWRPGEPLKSKAAERLVPLHGVLIDQGFRQYLARVSKKSKTEQLWPGIRVPKEDSGAAWGQPFSKWFTRARRTAGIYRPGMDFHSLRATFITALLNADVCPSSK